MRGRDKKFRIDLTGKKKNRLTVIKFSHSKGNNNIWECLCDCGNTTYCSTAYFNIGDKKSCGCLTKEIHTTHGFNNHPLYNVYRCMLKRCYNTKNYEYKNYGGRGIIVCQEWRQNPKSFFEWCISNGYKNGLELDRFPNNDGNYEPNNCRFATPKQNSNNTRKNVKLTLNGETLTISEWAEKLNMSVLTLRSRYYKRKFSVEKILSQTNLSSCRIRKKRGSYKTRSLKNL